MRGSRYTIPDEVKKILSLENVAENEAYRVTFEHYFSSIGMQKKRAIYLTELLFDDLKDYNTSYEQRIWALERGYLPNRIELYGLTEDNQDDYLSDFDYFVLHPLNNHFAIWINDKITLKYMLQKPMTSGEKQIQLMPDYYLYIENDGRYSYLMNDIPSLPHNKNYLLSLLKIKKILALKPSNGGGGYGFIRLEYKDGMIVFNGSIISELEFFERQENLNGYIVTDYVIQNSELDKIWPDSVCTLRVVAGRVRDNKYDSGKLEVFASHARFGTSRSNGASNLTAGGVALPFNFETGLYSDTFYQYKRFSNNGEVKMSVHPDTQFMPVNSRLPHHELVKEVVDYIGNLLSSLDFFGFDIMITEEGVNLCEINTHPSMDYAQIMFGPIWKNEKARSFFVSKFK